jgi:ABC-type amino acid transport substrate-binding protein
MNKRFFFVVCAALFLAPLFFASCSKKDAAALQLRNIEDLQDKRFCVIAGNLYDWYLGKRFPAAIKVGVNSAPDLLLGVEKGLCDGALIDGGQVKTVLEQRPSLGLLQDSVWMMEIAFGFSKENPALLAEFNQFLDTLAKNGELDRIVKGWAANADSMPLPVPPNEGAKGTLRVATTGTDIPITFVREGGALAGYDIDILVRFARAAGYKIEFSKLDFGALIAALAAGKADIIADNITISEERAKKVAFSTPYKHEPTAAVALNKHLAPQAPTAP